ncbi:MAG: type VI secretion system tip protein VgrG [Betaproteobacteria bacterium]|nr:type VI secretion system tip protein VgrG [Betaproteobacteria bacterium]
MDFRPAVKNSINSLRTPLEKLSAALPDLPFPALEDMLADFASAFTQNNRLFTLQIGDGKTYDDRLLPQSLEGSEALSENFRYEITCLSADAFIPLDGLLGLDAQIDILINGEVGQITRCGLISAVKALPSDGGFAKYLLTIEPPVAFLRYRTTSRVFQEKNVPDIVEQVLAEHLNANRAIGRTLKLKFGLTKQYPVRSYCIQYRETDLAFIERLLFEEGIAYRWEHESGDVATCRFVAFDDPWGLAQAGQGTVRFHRADATEPEDSLTVWTKTKRIGPGATRLTSYDYKSVRVDEAFWDSGWEERDGEVRNIPAESSLEDFDAQTLYYAPDSEELHRYATLRQDVHDRMKGGHHGEGNLRDLTAGQWFQLKGHPWFDRFNDDGEREFVACKLEFSAHNNLPQSLTKHLKRECEDTAPPPPYWVKISARKRGLPLTPAYAHTAHAKPTARGLQSAIVTGPEGEEVYTDEFGRIKIQFHWQRPKEHPGFGANFDENSSCWIRAASPSAGQGWGHQSIPRIGQEVLVSFLEGDIDRPYISGVVHNGRQPNPWFSGVGSLPANRALTGIKSKEHHGQQYNELLFDDTQNQVRTKLSSEHGKTQLNMGFLTHPRTEGEAEPRGDGVELRTDHHGAIRATEGLLITTEAQPGATGKQLAREGAQAQLESARQTAQTLSDTAEHQNADKLEIGSEGLDEEGRKGQTLGSRHLDHLVEAIKAWEAGTNTDPNHNSATGSQPGRQAVLLMSGVEGIGLVTPQEMVLTSRGNLDTISQRDTQQTTARRWIHNVGKKISLFVHGVRDKVNLKLIAAKGHAQLQAQSGDVEIVGDQNVRIHANKGKLTAVAGEEMLLTCAGAYIRLKDGKIDIRSPGKLSMKAANISFDGPASMNVYMPQFPDSNFDTEVEDNSPLSL